MFVLQYRPLLVHSMLITPLPPQLPTYLLTDCSKERQRDSGPRRAISGSAMSRDPAIALR